MSVWPNHNTRYSAAVISPHRMHVVQRRSLLLRMQRGLRVSVCLWVVDFGEPQEPCVRRGQNPSMERGTF